MFDNILFSRIQVGGDKEKDVPIEDDEENEKLQALAKKFEEKYVS